MRLLAVAQRKMAGDCAETSIADERELTFVGCAAFLDPPKASVTDAVIRLRQAGVRFRSSPAMLHRSFSIL